MTDIDRVSVSTFVAASPDRLYELVSDVTRMGEWSPETVSCRWLGGATGPRVGARFVGVNRHRGRWWRTSCEVVDAEPGRAFGFEVTAVGLKVSLWRFELAPAPGGSDLTEHWVDRRGAAMRRLGRLVFGIADRGDHNRRGMVETLARIKAAAEATPHV